MKTRIAILLWIIIGIVCALIVARSDGQTNSLPPLPPHSPTPQQEMESGIVVSRRIPPSRPRLAEWRNGAIYELSKDSFEIRVVSKWYYLYHCTDLVKGDWKLIARLESETALNDRLTYFHNHPEGFYRVVEKMKPHPPKSIGNLGQTTPVSTNRPFGGGFR